MFQAGKTVEQIAAERKLTVSTIQGHLAYYIQTNQIDIHRLLERDKLEEMEQFFTANPSATLTEAKAYFGSKFDYGELRIGIGYLQNRQK
jgi:uncharacterized protein YpbB